MAEEGGGGILRELLAVFGFGVDTKELDEGENRLEGFLDGVKRIGAAVAGAFVAKEIYEFAEANVHAMTAIERSAARLGVSTERVQEFQFAAESMGQSSEALLDKMGRLQVAQQLAAQGGKEQSKAFHALGISIDSLKKKSADEVFLDVAESVSKIQDPSKAAAAAVALFGRGGREILPFLKQGRAGVADLVEEFRQLGGGYSERALEMGKRQEAQSAKLNLAFKSLKSTILTGLLPVITWVTKKVTDLTSWLRKMTENSYIVEAALGVLGVAASIFAVKMALANLPILLITAAIAALILIVDDVITMFEGGQSVIGDTIDKIFGKGASAEAVQSIKDAWVGVKDAFAELVPYLKMAYDIFVKLFGIAVKTAEWYGDTYGKIGNFVKENVARATGKLGKGVGGRTTEQQAIHQSAEAFRAAQARGESVTPESYLTVPKGMSRGEAMSARMDELARMPAGAPAPVVSAPSVTVNVHPPKGSDHKQIGEHTAKAVAEVLKQERRAAAATIPRARGQ